MFKGIIFLILIKVYNFLTLIHDRIKLLAKQEGISISKLERELGVGVNSLSTTLRRRSSVPHTVIQPLAINNQSVVNINCLTTS